SVDSRRRHHAAITGRVSDRHLGHFAQLCLDQSCDPIDGWPSYGQMLETINRAISAEHHKVSLERRRQWASCFSKWPAQLWNMATPRCKRAPPAAGFDAAGTRAEWAPVWSPDDYGSDAKSATELLLINVAVAFLIRELCDVWLATTRMAVECGGILPRRVSDAIFEWRMVATPKKDENESRPISVAPCPLRAWLTAAATALHQPTDSQFARKQGLAVIHAASAWLAEEALFGLELDLSSACDNVDHALAAAGLAAQGAPEAVINVSLHAWRGPRYCAVNSEVAPALWTQRRLPQGDSVAPCAIVATLVLWTCSPATGWAFMDDRPIASMTEPDLAVGLERTAQFDSDFGYSENAAKCPSSLEEFGASYPQQFECFRVFLELLMFESSCAMNAIRSVRLLPSKHFERALTSYFEELGLERLGHDPEWGIRLGVDMEGGPRIASATAACR
ncbi:unnamed protein product, partial [Prorocentrum cordatum]